MKSNVKRVTFSIGFGVFLLSVLLTASAFSQTEISVKDKADVDKINNEESQAKVKKELEELDRKEDKIEKELAKSKKTGEQSKIEELTKALQEIKIQKNAKKSFVEKSLTSVAIIFIGLFLFLLMKIGLRQFENFLTRKDAIRESEMALRMKTMSKLFHWLGTIIIVGIILYMVLENHGLNVAPLLAGAGIIGLAFGFGGQYLIRDLINGLFILVEGQYRINDVVKIGEYGGL
ncbi:MAG: mechanosensitive ion channel domain-containing protein, partial [Candidatus Omnitrophota bacterium]